MTSKLSACSHSYSILSILPTGIFILSSLWLLRYILREQRHGIVSLLRDTRTIIIATTSTLLLITSALSLAAWQVATPYLVSSAKRQVTAALTLSLVAAVSISISGPIVVYLTVFQLFVLSLVPKLSNSRPTLFVTSLYLVLTLVLDTSRVRTFVLVGSQNVSGFFLIAFLVQYGCRFATFVVISLPPTLGRQENLEDASFLSHSFVLWALPLMWQGRHGNLEIDQLPALHSDMRTPDLYHRFEKYWAKER